MTRDSPWGNSSALSTFISGVSKSQFILRDMSSSLGDKRQPLGQQLSFINIYFRSKYKVSSFLETCRVLWVTRDSPWGNSSALSTFIPEVSKSQFILRDMSSSLGDKRQPLGQQLSFINIYFRSKYKVSSFLETCRVLWVTRDGPWGNSSALSTFISGVSIKSVHS